MVVTILDWLISLDKLQYVKQNFLPSNQTLKSLSLLWLGILPNISWGLPDKDPIDKKTWMIFILVRSIIIYSTMYFFGFWDYILVIWCQCWSRYMLLAFELKVISNNVLPTHGMILFGQVRYLHIAKKSPSYNPYRWVRYVTQSNSYVARLWESHIWFLFIVIKVSLLDSVIVCTYIFWDKIKRKTIMICLYIELVSCFLWFDFSCIKSYLSIDSVWKPSMGSNNWFNSSLALGFFVLYF